MDGILVNDSPYAAGGIDVGMSADHGAGIQHGVAAYFYIVAQHGADLFDAGLDLLFAVLYDHESLVGLDVGSDGACSHVAIVSEDGIANIVIVRCLNVIEEDDVLELDGVTHYAVCTNQSGASDEGTVADFRVRSNDAGSAEICRRKYLRCLVYPDVL